MMMQVFAGGGTCEATNEQQDEDKEGSARNVLAGGHTPRLALLPVGDCVRRRCFCLMNPSFLKFVGESRSPGDHSCG